MPLLPFLCKCEKRKSACNFCKFRKKTGMLAPIGPYTPPRSRPEADANAGFCRIATGSSRLASMRQQQRRTLRMLEKVAGNAADQELSQAAVAEGAHHQQLRLPEDQFAGQGFLYRAHTV